MVALTIPFVQSLRPTSEKRARYLDIDISKLKNGQMFTVAWLGKPIYILKRSPENLQTLQRDNPALLDPASEASIQPAEARNYHRSIRPDIFLALGVCTHLGCSVSHNPPGQNAEYGEPFEKGIWFCPCHGAMYDLAGRVYKNVPAERNLDIPEYKFLDEHTIRIDRPFTR